MALSDNNTYLLSRSDNYKANSQRSQFVQAERKRYRRRSVDLRYGKKEVFLHDDATQGGLEIQKVADAVSLGAGVDTHTIGNKSPLIN